MLDFIQSRLPSDGWAIFFCLVFDCTGVTGSKNKVVSPFCGVSRSTSSSRFLSSLHIDPFLFPPCESFCYVRDLLRRIM